MFVGRRRKVEDGESGKAYAMHSSPQQKRKPYEGLTSFLGCPSSSGLCIPQARPSPPGPGGGFCDDSISESHTESRRQHAEPVYIGSWILDGKCQRDCPNPWPPFVLSCWATEDVEMLILYDNLAGLWHPVVLPKASADATVRPAAAVANISIKTFRNWVERITHQNVGRPCSIS